MKNDLIRRQDVLHELEGCDYELKDWQRWKLKTMVRDIPSAEKAQLFGEDATKDATSGLISRKEATTIPVMPKEHREYQTMNLDDAYEQGWFDCQKCIKELPSAEPERQKGVWIVRKDCEGKTRTCVCGLCGYTTDKYTWVNPNYCSGCGADMRG